MSQVPSPMGCSGTDVSDDPDAVGPEPVTLKELLEIVYAKPYQPRLLHRPAQLLRHVFIGSYENALDLCQLKDLGITHVLNCAAYTAAEDSPYEDESDIVGYLHFHSKDEEDYDMMQYYVKAKAFLDAVEKDHGIALVICAMGINRSGLICVAYLMDHENWDVLRTLQYLKNKRSIILSNKGFVQQLLQFSQLRSSAGNNSQR